MDSDLLSVLIACANGNLANAVVSFSAEPAACVVIAAGGYPGDYRKGDVISGLDEANAVEGVYVFHAGTAEDAQGRATTSGGRVLGVTARGPDIKTALGRAYKAAGLIHWDDAYYRKDIGAKALRRLS